MWLILFFVVFCNLLNSSENEDLAMSYWKNAFNYEKDGCFEEALQLYLNTYQRAHNIRGKVCRILHLDFEADQSDEILKKLKNHPCRCQLHSKMRLSENTSKSLNFETNNLFNSSFIHMIHYSESEIQKEKDARDQAIDRGLEHIYDAAKESMNFQA